MDYDKLKYRIECFRKYCEEDGLDADDLFIAGHIMNTFTEYTGEDLDTIGDTHPREGIWMNIKSSYEKVLEEIKNYDKDGDDYIVEYCGEDEEKYANEPYVYKIFLEAIKEAKKKNPKIYVTRYGPYTTEIFKEYAKLYHKSKEVKKKPLKKK